jgi:predicted RNase H-like nuclease (RuvC/YqgF family)
MKIKIPTLTEVYPELVQAQTMKQQTSLLTAILELHESLKNINRPEPDPKLQLRVEQLQQEIVGLQTEIKALTQENEDLNRELDLQEKSEAETSDLARELEFQRERFATLQEHYKNSTNFAKQLQNELLAAKEQMVVLNLNKPKGFKSWEDAATTERLHHNQTKMDLANKMEELAASNLKLERFQKLFKEALGQ